MESYEWSDLFFNYVPAEQAVAEYYANVGFTDYEQLIELLLPMAQQFKEANPNCPYDVEWLVKNYMKRI